MISNYVESTRKGGVVGLKNAFHEELECKVRRRAFGRFGGADLL